MAAGARRGNPLAPGRGASYQSAGMGLVRFLPRRLAIWARAVATVRRDFAAEHGRPPRLLRPRGFTDKMQWRKLFQHDPRFAVFCDKLATRDHVAARVGAERLVPLLWQGARPEEIPFDRLDPPFVLKPSHSCGRCVLVRSGEVPDPDLLRATAAAWLRHCHGSERIEPGYVNVPRRLMVERLLLSPSGGPPREYKVLVFAGRVGLVQILERSPRDRSLSLAYHDRNWAPVSLRFKTAPSPLPLPSPARQAEIITLAERLAAGIDHLRVDLYETAAGLHVGELTCYSWSGLSPVTPTEADIRLGALWPLRSPALRALAAVAFGRWEIRPGLR